MNAEYPSNGNTGRTRLCGRNAARRVSPSRLLQARFALSRILLEPQVVPGGARHTLSLAATPLGPIDEQAYPNGILSRVHRWL